MGTKVHTAEFYSFRFSVDNFHVLEHLKYYNRARKDMQP